MPASYLSSEFDVALSSLMALESWLDESSNVPNTVESLCLYQEDSYGITTPQDLKTILNAFPNVESLALRGLNLTSSSKFPFETLGLHGHKLTSLVIADMTAMAAETYHRLLLQFSNLENLTLHRADRGGIGMMSEWPTMPITITLDDKAKRARSMDRLTLSEIHEPNYTSLVPLEMAFKEVYIEDCRFKSREGVGKLLEGSVETVKKVVIVNTEGIFHVDFSKLQVLEELRFDISSLKQPDGWVEGFLKNIPSHNLRRVVFRPGGIFTSTNFTEFIEPTKWGGLDQLFKKWAEALPDGQQLGVVFNLFGKVGRWDGSQPDLPDPFLSDCRESGSRVVVKFENVDE